MRILIATSNPYKLEEIKAVISDDSIELVTLDALPEKIDEPVEDQDTFEGNAVLKARYYAKTTGMLCLADDSGLEVDALNGEPGVRSARYSNTDGPRAERDAANSLALLKNLGDTPIEKRAARFVCAMALVDGRKSEDESEPIAVVRGTLEGRILTIEEADDPAHPQRGRGANGFGYDPIVFLPDRNKTVAELTSDEKNAISHRGCAVCNIMYQICELSSNEIQKLNHRATTVDMDVIKDFVSAAVDDHTRARKLLEEYPKLLDTNVTCGETVLHCLTINAQIQGIEFLAGEGFEIDPKNTFGDTPLMDAAGMGEVETAEVLLRHGADPNARSPSGDCALFCAIKSGYPKMVKLLLDHGASLSYKDSWGHGVFDITKELNGGRSEIEPILRKAMDNKSGS